MIRSAFIRPRKQSERESRENRYRERECAFIRADSIGFQAALQEIRLESVVIPPGSPLYPASFTMLPLLSSSVCASQSMIHIKHYPGSDLYLLAAEGTRDAVKLHLNPQELQISCRANRSTQVHVQTVLVNWRNFNLRKQNF